MSPQWRARLLMAVLGALLLLLALYKAPERGWWVVWVAAAFLIVGPVLAGLESKRPPRPFKQRRLINTAVLVGGTAIAYAIPDLIKGTGFSWDNWSFRLLLLLMVGLITWFGIRPEEPHAQDAGERTH